MKLVDVLAGLFPQGHNVAITDGLLEGKGKLEQGRDCVVLGITGANVLGVEGALWLSKRVLGLVAAGGDTPLLLLLDAGTQRISLRDEMIGLSEYLSHLAKTLWLAQARGHRTVTLLYGGAAACAFIATGLATHTLVALPSAHPAVIDLAAMAHATRLSLAVVKARAEASAVFAPGLANLRRAGAVHAVWDGSHTLAERLVRLLADPPSDDTRDRLGLERGGRVRAAIIADRVLRAARQN